MAFVPNYDSPILHLNKDVLTTIFSSNADMFTDRAALTITRQTSQVCKEWRSMLLDSPTIWAKLIDFDELQRGSEEWRREILRRSGTSSNLWIRANNLVEDNVDTRPIKTFLFSILNIHWERVERLVLNLNVAKLHPSQWTVLYQPAPHLQVFEVRMHGIDRNASPAPRPFFNNSAPLLHTLEALDLKLVTTAPWLCGLRSLNLRNDAMQISDLLKALALMPLLTTLQFEKFGRPGPAVDLNLPSAILPELKEINLWVNIVEWGTILEHITPVKGCSLSLHHSIGEITDDASLQSLPRFVDEYCKTHRPSYAFLDIESKCFCFELKPHGEAKPGFSVSVKLPVRSEGISPSSFSRFLVMFSPSSLTYLSEMELHLSQNHLTGRSFKAILAFSGLKVLHCDERVLGYFIDIQQTSNVILFPNLTQLNLFTLDSSYFRGLDGDLFPFLCHRRDAGYSIQILDLTMCNPDVSPRLTFLEEMKALKLFWQMWSSDEIFSYECGSGQPEKIPFPYGAIFQDDFVVAED
ncbi:hypothetical protein CVT26_015640 [Gymnopilus dilepis]|uniref:F-box domain-containing protein n=1 Tax=Gymnopilus dilepis TaxID=231916 RepID=A0A409YDH1_9AGAR|nr:hypothetical protein CVT26_015640 [Gymnopilus dilepis]